ncbi:U32 family peptidase [Escherichia coli]
MNCTPVRSARSRTVEKAKFLSDVGFTQIVLARELNLEQIRAISPGHGRDH